MGFGEFMHQNICKMKREVMMSEWVKSDQMFESLLMFENACFCSYRIHACRMALDHVCFPTKPLLWRQLNDFGFIFRSLGIMKL